MKATPFFSLFTLYLLCPLAVSHAGPGGAWQETRTAHCVFIYQAGDEEAVRELYGFAEDVYAAVTSYFDTYPREVRSVVLGRVDVANGSYSAPPHHLELFVRAPTSPWHGARGESWLKLLFIHELAHYCDMDADYGFFSVLSFIFGEGVKSGGNALLPPWTYEGVAVFLETELSRGGRGRNPFFEMHARALLLDDVPFTLGHLEYGSAYPPPSRYYLFGYYFIDYLKRHYGRDVYKNIRRTFLEFPLAGPWSSIRRVTGRHQDELWTDFRRELKERFHKEEPLMEGESVTPPGYVNYHSPRLAGLRWFAYRTAIDRPPAIVVLDPEKKTEQVVMETGLTDEQSYALTPDGRLLAWTETRASGIDAGRYREISDLYLSDLNDHGMKAPRAVRVRRLTVGKRLWHPAFAPDGRRLVAVQGVAQYSRLVTVDPGTGRVAVIFAEEDANVYNPAYSPDGRRIAFAVNRFGQQDIYVLDADAPLSPQDEAGEALINVNVKSVRRLPALDSYGDYFPRFLDNRTILFTSDREGLPALYTYSLDQGVLTRVCRDRIAAFDGVPVPAGLLYTTYRATGYRLDVARAGELESVVLPPPADEPAPPPGPRPEIVSAPYTDLPGFQLWVPNMDFMTAQNSIHIGFGVYALFASTMDSNGFDIAAVYYPSFNQPEFSFQYRTQIGPLNVYYKLTHEFEEWGQTSTLVYYETFMQSLGLELPLLDEEAVSGSDYLACSIAFRHLYLMESAAPFSFLGGFGSLPVNDGHFPSVAAELLFSHRKYAGPAALFPPWTVFNTFTVRVPLPFLSETRVGAVFLDYFYATLPGLWSLSSFRLGLKACYVTPELLGAAYLAPRGGFPAAVQTEPLRGIFVLEYLFTIAYLDCPIVGGTHLDALGAGFFWEVPFDADPGAALFAWDGFCYAGASLSLVVGLGKWRLPVTVGFSLRLDWQAAEPLGWDDCRIFIQLSLNTFLTGARTVLPPRDL